MSCNHATTYTHASPRRYRHTSRLTDDLPHLVQYDMNIGRYRLAAIPPHTCTQSILPNSYRCVPELDQIQIDPKYTPPNQTQIPLSARRSHQSEHHPRVAGPNPFAVTMSSTPTGCSCLCFITSNKPLRLDEWRQLVAFSVIRLYRSRGRCQLELKPLSCSATSRLTTLLFLTVSFSLPLQNASHVHPSQWE